MRIVKADGASKTDWLRLRAALWPCSPKERLREEAERILASEREDAFLAITEDGTIGGFVEVSLRHFSDGCTTSPVGYIEGVYVGTEWRRCGIGRELIAAAESWAREQGCTEVGSDTAIANELSIAFHKAVGYREVERSVIFIKPLRPE